MSKRKVSMLEDDGDEENVNPEAVSNCKVSKQVSILDAMKTAQERVGKSLENKCSKKTKESQWSNIGDSGKCNDCFQKAYTGSDVPMFTGDVTDALDEVVLLTDQKLQLILDDDHEDFRPQLRITDFNVYCKSGHLTPFTNYLIERNRELFISGYVKPIFSDNVGKEDGVEGKLIGPIVEWFISGFDGSDGIVIGLSTAFAEYIVMEPSSQYADIFRKEQRKMFMAKYIIEKLSEDKEIDVEDLIDFVSFARLPPGVPPISEEDMITHCQFVIDQIEVFDIHSYGDDDAMENTLMGCPALQALAKLAGAFFRKKKRHGERFGKLGSGRGDLVKPDRIRQTKATVTSLVRRVFDSFFGDQIAEDTASSTAPRRRRCGVCEGCQQPDCGKCKNCLNMTKFGGTGTSKQACALRVCQYMEEEGLVGENSGDEAEDVEGSSTARSPGHHVSRKQASSDRSTETATFTWLSEPKEDSASKRAYHREVRIERGACVLEVALGDAVRVNSETSFVVGRVMAMWECRVTDKSFVHVWWFERGRDSLLGETADPKEVFVSPDCQTLDLREIHSKLTVNFLATPADWFDLGSRLNEGDESADYVNKASQHGDADTFFCQKFYDPQTSRFEDIPERLATFSCVTSYSTARVVCPCCDYTQNLDDFGVKVWPENQIKNSDDDRSASFASFVFRNWRFCVGDSCYLFPGSFTFPRQTKKVKSIQKNDHSSNESDDNDEDEGRSYKTSRAVRHTSLKDTPDPFQIGQILEIRAPEKISEGGSYDVCNISLTVRKLYRPENLPDCTTSIDLNLLYCSQDTCQVPLRRLRGPVRVHFVMPNAVNPVQVDGWLNRKSGPEFYCCESYDKTNNRLIPVPFDVRSSLRNAQHASKWRALENNQETFGSSKSEAVKEDDDEPSTTEDKRLKIMDVFAGCGGLSIGLKQSGIGDACWAIEFDQLAADAYKLNHSSKCQVFTNDCNALLASALKGGCALPKPREVDLLCGGPPCQGFSGMNRFSQRDYSQFKNSLVASYLSYADFYRPKYLILENVRNFVSFKRSMVLKLTLQCLLRMGYQLSFAVLQAGVFGVPQTRRRVIVLACAPGQPMPCFPAQKHVFPRNALQLSVTIEGKRFDPVDCVTSGLGAFFAATDEDTEFGSTKIRHVSRWDWNPRLTSAAPPPWTSFEMNGSKEPSEKSAPFRPVTVRDALSDLPVIHNGQNDEKLSYMSDPQSHVQRILRSGVMSGVLTEHKCKLMSPLVLARMQHIPIKDGADWRALPNSVVRLSDNTLTSLLRFDFARGKGVCPCAEGRPCDASDRQTNTLIPWCLPHTAARHNQWAGLYGRLTWDGFFSTTVTNPEPMGKQGRVLHPTQPRVVSVRECARSQGFPDHVQFVGSTIDRHRQVGNAVPPPLAKAIGDQISLVMLAKELSK